MPAPNPIQIRVLEPENYGLLEQFTLLAVHLPSGAEPDWAALRNALAHYYQRFGRPGDLALAARVGGKTVGMVWARLFTASQPGYAYLDAETPEISLAILPEWRGQGLGKALTQALLRELGRRGYSQVSLSVSPDNTAARGLYQALGFETVSEAEGGITMRRQLEKPEG